MGHLIRDSAPLELFAWLAADTELPGWDVLTGNPFGTPLPDDQFTTEQNYFAEYHLEYCRQRQYSHFPSRLHSLLLFATRVDAESFRLKHPARVAAKSLVCARSRGPYVVSFHDSCWLDYLRLPHSLSLASLDDISNHYWKGTLVEEAGLTFMNRRWAEPPVIEALFQGTVEPHQRQEGIPRLPGFSPLT